MKLITVYHVESLRILKVFWVIDLIVLELQFFGISVWLLSPGLIGFAIIIVVTFANSFTDNVNCWNNLRSQPTFGTLYLNTSK